MFGNSSECTRVTTSRHSREVSSTLALSTDVTRLRAASKAGARDPLDLGRVVEALIARGGLAARLLAEVDAAGQLAHHEQVGALDDLALERAGVVERLQRPDGPQVGVEAEPLAQAEQPLLGARLVGVGGVPLRAADRGRAARRRRLGRRRASRRSARCRGRRSTRRRRRAPRIRSPRRRRGRGVAAPRISGPMPSPGSVTMRAAIGRGSLARALDEDGPPPVGLGVEGHAERLEVLVEPRARQPLRLAAAPRGLAGPSCSM